MIIGAESKVLEPGSNYDQVCYIHYCINALEKHMNSFLHLPAMGQIDWSL